MKSVCWHQWNQKSSSESVSSPWVYLVLSRSVPQEHWLNYCPDSMPDSWLDGSGLLCHICLCGCVGARKQRVLVDLNSSDSKQHLVRGQMCLALCQGQAQSSPSPTYLIFPCLSWLLLFFQRFLSLQSSSSAACQGAPVLTSRKSHFSCSLALFFHCIVSLGDQVAAELWLGCMLLFQTHWWSRGPGWAGSGGSASRKDGNSVRIPGCAVRAGRRAEQPGLVQMSSAAVEAPFPMASAVTTANRAPSMRKSTLVCWL